MPSHLYSFLDDANNLNAHFLEGTALIQELETKHIFTDAGKAYFEHCLLSCLPLVSFLKYGESLGIYFDSEEPYFRFKIELNAYGKVRALLLPENFNICPVTFTGQVRVAKIMEQGKTPYTSVLAIQQLPISEVINQILTQSYQAPAKVISSPTGFQSILWHKVPLKVLTAPPVDLDQYQQERQQKMLDFLNTRPTDLEKIKAFFAELGLVYLGDREISFQCGCSKERMQNNLNMLSPAEKEELFANQDTIEGKCDYCKKVYTFTRQEICKVKNS